MSHSRKVQKARRAAIYARVSSEKGGRDSAVSIHEQIRDCTARIVENGDILVATYIDDARYRSEFSGRKVEPSAKRADRPDWRRMLAAAGKEFEVLYAWRTDRICRGNETTGVFERVLDDTNIDVVLVTQVFDRDTFGLLAGGVSGYELRTIAVRMMMGREGRVRLGYHQGPFPAGYTAIRDDLGQTIGYKLLPGWRERFDRIAEMFIAGAPLAEIGRRLDLPGGRPVVHVTVSYWLRSPFYRGRIEYGWKVRPPDQRVYNEKSVHEPTWSPDVIAAIDAEMARRAALGKRGHRRRKWTYLFAGVLRCGYCGRNLAQAGQSEAGTINRRYRCNQTRLAQMGFYGENAHPLVHIPEGRIEQWLEPIAKLTPEQVDRWLEAHFSEPKGRPASQVALQAEIDQLEARAVDLKLALDRVRELAPSAAALITRELGDISRSVADAQQQISANQVKSQQLSRERMRGGMLELIAAWENIKSMPYEAQAALYQRCLPPLHVKPDGFCSAPGVVS